jgi:hypothetical protein
MKAHPSPPNIRTNGASASLEEAKADFQKCWDWKGWAKLGRPNKRGASYFAFTGSEMGTN